MKFETFRSDKVKAVRTGFQYTQTKRLRFKLNLAELLFLFRGWFKGKPYETLEIDKSLKAK